MDLARIPIHQDKGRDHLNDSIAFLIIDIKGPVAEESIVSLCRCLDGVIFIKHTETIDLHIVIRDNPDQIIVL